MTLSRLIEIAYTYAEAHEKTDIVEFGAVWNDLGDEELEDLGLLPLPKEERDMVDDLVDEYKDAKRDALLRGIRWALGE